MRQQGVNAVIALTHLGIGQNSDPSSADIATHVTGIDLIIDGYSHTLYPNGYTDYPGYVAGQTPMIVQAGSSLEAFGVVELSFDENGGIMSILPFTVDAESVSSVTADKKIGSVISTYAQEQQTLSLIHIFSHFEKKLESFRRTGTIYASPARSNRQYQ